jgi:hypothetical protein
METKLYAVSRGNGNDGVSQMFPDYYVRTNDPYRLARLALVTQFLPCAQEQVLDECRVEGEADYTISAVLYDPLDEEPAEDGMSWCDANGAYMIVEVFPDDGPDMADPYHRFVYDSINECFSVRELALINP